MKRLFIPLLLALPVAVSHAGPGDTHYVGTLQADVKDAPSSDANTKFVIAIGRKVVEFGREGDWALVGIDRTGGKDGWVRASDLKSTDPDGLR